MSYEKGRSPYSISFSSNNQSRFMKWKQISQVSYQEIINNGGKKNEKQY